MLHKLLSWVIGFMMMVHLDQTGAIKIKPVEASTDKWADNAARSAEAFAAEAEASADAWARNTEAAADTYGLAISAPGIKARFKKGVSRAGATKFALKIRQVAKDRFGPGVAFGKDDYKTGVEPYFSTIAALTLTARKPKGDPANYKRVEEVGKALNAKRLALLGATAAS